MSMQVVAASAAGKCMARAANKALFSLRLFLLASTRVFDPVVLLEAGFPLHHHPSLF